jgi:peptidoglycan hydrolase-like protein with peptidoglycan-binding domain
MTLKLLGQFLFVGFIAAALSGCATMRQKDNPESQALKTQISDLESQLDKKDAEIDSLRKALSRTTEEKYKSSKMTAGSGSSAAVPSISQIQTALQNAGYTIEVDGKMGSQTKAAIKDFQKANELEADGKVGKRTWAVLEPYLNKQ